MSESVKVLLEWPKFMGVVMIVRQCLFKWRKNILDDCLYLMF
jgi:hypothetical protein